ncbi:MAG: FAD-dependent oxidoreductase [Candidatus Brocadiales bacterium]
MTKPKHISILGGGTAGLAVGYYAQKNRLSFTIYEASNRIGGNCITLRHGDFLFDSGAHRFHDKDAEATKELKKLFGEDLKKTNVPSQIYYNRKFIDFPLSPLNLLRNLGLYTFAKAGLELVRSRLRGSGPNGNFENFALHTYGKTIAELFLLNYSEKLWGLPCNRLSSHVSGKRMKGLGLKGFFVEAIFGRNAKIEHLDGSFYYPKMGFGTIAERLGEFCGKENILRNSKITKILHNHTRIQAIEVDGNKKIDTDEVVSTLPITHLLQMMDPKPTEEILLLARNLRYRNLKLVTLFLDRGSVTENTSVYFPNADFLFTRIYEPKNRSIYMSPRGKTSLVMEIPCQQDDTLWNMEDDRLVLLIRSQIIQIGLINEEEIIGASVNRISYAYPILEVGFEERIQKIIAFLEGFDNLKLSGRNGKFVYTHVHDMMKYGKEIIEGYICDYKKAGSRTEVLR